MNNENSKKPIPEILPERMLIELTKFSRTSLWRARNDEVTPLKYFKVRGKIFYR